MLEAAAKGRDVGRNAMQASGMERRPLFACPAASRLPRAGHPWRELERLVFLYGADAQGRGALAQRGVAGRGVLSEKVEWVDGWRAGNGGETGGVRTHVQSAGAHARPLICGMPRRPRPRIARAAPQAPTLARSPQTPTHMLNIGLPALATAAYSSHSSYSWQSSLDTMSTTPASCDAWPGVFWVGVLGRGAGGGVGQVWWRWRRRRGERLKGWQAANGCSSTASCAPARAQA